MNTITINDVAYPCQPTVGAMRRFKRLAGKDVTKIDQSDFDDLCTFLYCCVAAACNRDKIDLPYSIDDFFDSMDPEALNAWAMAQNANNPEAGEKKT